MRALFRTLSSRHTMIAQAAGVPEQAVGHILQILRARGFVRIGDGVVRPLRTVTGQPIRPMTEDESRALVDAAVRGKKVTTCPAAHAMGANTFLPFRGGGRWFGNTRQGDR